MPNSTNNILNKSLLCGFNSLQKVIYIVSACLLYNINSFSQCVFHTAAGTSTYTVANNTTIRVVARGGDGSFKVGGNGGSGATIGATFSAQAGDIITLYVGSVAPVNNIAGGGGGATGVVLTRPGTGANYLLLVAGGGGGGSVNGGTGGQGGRSSVSSAAAAGSFIINNATGGGGYGFTANGWNDNTYNYHLTGGGAGATIPATGGVAALPAIGAGGTNNNSSNGGNGGAGFGGGGAGHQFYGGGGGGYAGGSGGNSGGYAGSGGYGGTSYVNTAGLSGTIVLQQDGIDGNNLNSTGSANANGEVDIEELTSGVNTSTWKGSTSTSVTVAKNWCGIVPSSSNDILIVPGTTFSPAISGTGSYHNLTINAGASLSVTGTLQLNGNLNNNGTLSATTGTLVLNGTTAQTINANTTVKNLTLNNSAGATLSSALNVTGIITPTAGILSAAGYLTLKSTNTGTASVAAGGSTNYIAGNVTVERYLPAHATRSYTLVSSPVGAPTIYTAWQEDGITTNTGYGTLITGASTGAGFDAASAAGIASVYSYNDNNATGSKWAGLTNTNATSLNAGTGYLLFVRGDRGTQPGSSTGSSATTLRATGALQRGNVNFLTSGGTTGTPALLSGANQYNLIANPYACAIDWIQTTQGNLTGAFTVYDPNLAVFITSDGTTKSPNVGQQQARYIQNGQAFFIQNDGSGSTPFLVIAEYTKNTTVGSGTAVTVFGNSNKAQLNLNLYKQDTVFADGTVAVFGKGYSRSLDKEDIPKFTNFNEMVSFHTGDKNLSIDKRPMPATTDTLFVNMKQMQAGTAYKAVIDATGFDNSNIANAVLIDQLTGNSQVLDLTAKNEYPFIFTGSADSSRLMIVLNAAKTVVVTPPVNSDSTAAGLTLSLSPNPVKDQLQVSFHTNNTQHKQIRLINAAGQPVQTIDAGTVADGKVMMSVAANAAGLYTVELLSGSARVQTAKLIKQ